MAACGVSACTTSANPWSASQHAICARAREARLSATSAAVSYTRPPAPCVLPLFVPRARRSPAARPRSWVTMDG